MDVLAPDGWVLEFAPLSGRKLGEVCWSTKTITIDPRIPPAAQRCTLVHELVHVDRGPSPAPQFDAKEELAVERAAARRLIDIRDLAEAMAESESPGHIAELLEVDTDTLLIRLAYLHPAERAHLRRRLGRVNGSEDGVSALEPPCADPPVCR